MQLLHSLCEGLSFPQCNGSLLLCKVSYAACQLNFSVMLFGFTKNCGGPVTRHPSLCSGAFRPPENWALGWSRNPHAKGSLYLNVIDCFLVLLDFRWCLKWLKSEVWVLKSLACGGNHTIRLWGQVYCGFWNAWAACFLSEDLWIRTVEKRGAYTVFKLIGGLSKGWVLSLWVTRY